MTSPGSASPRPTGWAALGARIRTLGRRPGGRRPADRAARPPIEVVYRPEADGDADPGEVVWTWVPYEEDPTQGKDRPVVVVGRWGPRHLAAVPLTSKARPGDPDRFEVGRGRWDDAGRSSFARLDRVLAVAPHRVRREGAALDRARFDRLVARLGRRPGWPRVPVEVVGDP